MALSDTSLVRSKFANFEAVANAIDTLETNLALTESNNSLKTSYLVGTASALTGTTNPSFASPPSGRIFTVQSSLNNNAGATLNLNGTGAYPIHYDYGTPIRENMLVANKSHALLFEGVHYQLLNPAGIWNNFGPPIVQGVSITGFVSYCKYKFTDHSCIYQGACGLTSAGTAGALISIGLPVAAVNTGSYGRMIGTAHFYDASLATNVCAVFSGGTTMSFSANGSNGNNFGTVPNFAIANGDYVSWHVEYEIA